jgi:hypothetical protein
MQMCLRILGCFVRGVKAVVRFICNVLQAVCHPFATFDAYILTKIRDSDASVSLKEAYAKQSWISETMVAGSQILFSSDDELPAPQVVISRREGDCRRAVGCGYRDGDYLITAKHNFQARPDESFYVSGLVIRREDKDVRDRPCVNIGLGKELLKTGLTIAVDAIAIKLNCWPELGVKSAKISQFKADDRTTEACVYGPSGGFSVGAVKLSKDMPTRVFYEGSTQPGFSGAPYVLGGKVIGMHTTGGPNSGYAADFLSAMLECELRPREEVPESGDYILDGLRLIQADQRRKCKVTRISGYHDDRYFVRFPGTRKACVLWEDDISDEDMQFLDTFLDNSPDTDREECVKETKTKENAPANSPPSIQLTSEDLELFKMFIAQLKDKKPQSETKDSPAEKPEEKTAAKQDFRPCPPKAEGEKSQVSNLSTEEPKSTSVPCPLKKGPSRSAIRRRAKRLASRKEKSTENTKSL